MPRPTFFTFVVGYVTIRTVILTSRNCTVEQLDSTTADCLSFLSAALKHMIDAFLKTSRRYVFTILVHMIYSL